MTDLVLVAAVALGASALTLFSGFGLGTLLLPVFALLFPIPVAVAATAVVHLCNNLFKLALVGRHASWRVVVRFGLTAAVGAFAGAQLLLLLAAAPLSWQYEMLGHTRSVEAVKLVIGLLIAVFAVFEISNRLSQWSMPSRYLPVGGMLSGFFGGLSGNQGALRAAFLIRAGLDKQAFVGTSVICSVIVDTLRIAIYGFAFLGTDAVVLDSQVQRTVSVAVIAAFTGAFIGVRLLQKVTLRFVQLCVGWLMILIGGGLAAGLL